jgi:hypothetical protein
VTHYTVIIRKKRAARQYYYAHMERTRISQRREWLVDCYCMELIVDQASVPPVTRVCVDTSIILTTAIRINIRQTTRLSHI